MIAKIEINNDVTVIHMQGSLDVSLQKKLKDELVLISEKNPNDLILELSKVDFIDSSCLGTLVSVSKLLRTKEGDLKLANPTDDVRSIFNITRLDRVFEIFDSTPEAVESYFK